MFDIDIRFPFRTADMIRVQSTPQLHGKPSYKSQVCVVLVINLVNYLHTWKNTELLAVAGQCFIGVCMTKENHPQCYCA